jgi:bacteriocin-like protein
MTMQQTSKNAKRKSVTDRDQLIKTSKENSIELSEDELKRVSGGIKFTTTTKDKVSDY